MVPDYHKEKKKKLSQTRVLCANSESSTTKLCQHSGSAQKGAT